METIPSTLEPTLKKERLLVVSGGGCRGAWSGGLAKHLTEVHRQPYRYVFGTSTGSLMAPLIVLNEFDRLKEAYTSVNQNSIFDVNPFTKDGNINKLNAIWRIIQGKQSFGESNNLKRTMYQFLSEEDYNHIVTASPASQFNVCVLNYKTGEALYKQSQKDLPFEEMLNWMWASSNQPILMNFIDKKYLPGGSYVDGGVRNIVPVIEALQYAIKNNISAIDVIISKPEDVIINKEFEPSDILTNLLRLVEIWEAQVQSDNVKIAKLLNKLQECNNSAGTPTVADHSGSLTLTNYYMSPQLYKNHYNDLLFDKEKMKELWKKGEGGDISTMAVNPTYRIPINILDTLFH